jgi:proliferating cell nuclear antigen PCNA
MDIKLNNLSKVDEFAALFQNMKIFTDHINIDINEERIYIQTMDNCKISLLEVVIPKSWFCAYSCPIPITLGINTNIFYKILSSRDKVQTMHMYYNTSDEDKLYIDMESTMKTVFNRNFEIPLMDLSYDMLDITAIEYQADITLPSSDFALLINQLRGFGETLQFVCNENKIEMISKSIDQGKMSVIVDIDDLSAYAIEEEKEIDMSFSLKCLHNICSFSKNYKDVEIKMHSDSPLYVCYSDGELSIKIYLAPQMSGDD